MQGWTRRCPTRRYDCGRGGPAATVDLGRALRRARQAIGRRDRRTAHLYVITPATRVAGSVTWVHSGTRAGCRSPRSPPSIADLNCRLADEADRVLLCVDGVHGLGAVDASVDDLGGRLPRRRNAQVAVRSAGHRPHLGSTSMRGRRWQPTVPTFAAARLRAVALGRRRLNLLTPGARTTRPVAITPSSTAGHWRRRSQFHLDLGRQLRSPSVPAPSDVGSNRDSSGPRRRASDPRR